MPKVCRLGVVGIGGLPGGYEVMSQNGQVIIWRKKKRGNNINMLGLANYQLCENLNNPSYSKISRTPWPWVLAKNSSPYFGSRSQRESRSGSLLSTPLMCCVLTWHSHLACKKTSSLRQACRNGSLAFPVWMTTTVLKLSHSIVPFFPAWNRPQIFKATVRVSTTEYLLAGRQPSQKWRQRQASLDTSTKLAIGHHSTPAHHLYQTRGLPL